MERPPKWYLPVTILALLWNLIGCLAYLGDVTLTPEDVAKMTEAQQAMYNARPAWAVAATAIAVWGGAAGCVGLIMRKGWALALLIASLLALVVQDVAIFAVSPGAASPDPVALGLQAFVLLIGIGLVLLARKAMANGWIAAGAE